MTLVPPEVVATVNGDGCQKQVTPIKFYINNVLSWCQGDRFYEILRNNFTTSTMFNGYEYFSVTRTTK